MHLNFRNVSGFATAVCSCHWFFYLLFFCKNKFSSTPRMKLQLLSEGYSLHSHLCWLFSLISLKGVSVTSTLPSACWLKGTSSASVNTIPLGRTASDARRASKPSPGKQVPTCLHQLEPPTPVCTCFCTDCSYPTQNAETFNMDVVMIRCFQTLIMGKISTCMSHTFLTFYSFIWIICISRFKLIFKTKTESISHKGTKIISTGLTKYPQLSTNIRVNSSK